jgi:hypothetical protein
MYGRARFSAGEKKALTVPSSALVKQGQVEKVFVVDGGTARGRLVTTGLAHGSAIEVLSGLKAGESVVSPVPASLQDGSRIEVRQ